MADFGGTLAAQGLNTIFNIGTETTYGTAATMRYTGLADEFTPAREDEVYEGRGITNTRTATNLTTTSSRYPVSIRGKLDSGYPIAAVAGYIQNAAENGTHGQTTTDPFISIFRGASHTSPGQAYLPSFTVGRTFDDENDNLRIFGVTFETGTFSCDLDNPWTYDISGVGKSSDTDTAVTGTGIGGYALGSWNTTVGIDLNASAWSSSDQTLYGLRNISYTINNNLRTRNEFGTSAPVSIRQSKFGIGDIELRLTRGYIDDDFWDQIADGGTNSFKVETTDGTATLTKYFNDCRLKTMEQAIGTDDETMETTVLVVKDFKMNVSSDGIDYVIWD